MFITANVPILRQLHKMSRCRESATLSWPQTPFVSKNGFFPFLLLLQKWVLNMIDLEKVQLQKLALERQFNYKFKTSFWEEFSISDQYGAQGVVEHYNLVFDQWKDNLKYLTELVLVLNWKIYQWYQVDDTLGMTYDDLWKRTDSFAMDTLRGEDLHYYLSVLD